MKDTDIVAQLRLYAQKQRETKSSVLGLLLSDAADEIERLRKELQESEDLLDEYRRIEMDRNRWENTNDC